MEASDDSQPPVGTPPKLRSLPGDVEIAAMLATDRGARGAARLELMLNTVLGRLTAEDAAGENAS
jgi:hypothetical protein